MSLLDSIKNIFKKGVSAMQPNQGLGLITDDPRINLPPSELTRIQTALRYYRNDFKDVKFYNTLNQLKHRKPYTLSVTKSASRQLASIIANEGFNISVQSTNPDGKDNSQSKDIDDYLQQVFDRSNFYQNYEENLEVGIATGGFAIRPFIQNNVVKLAWIRADQFVPLDSNSNEVNSAAIVSKSSVSANGTTTYYSLIEFHEYDPDSRVEMISNELYQSNFPDSVGTRVSLSTLEAYSGLSDSVQLTNISRPTFAYFKSPGKNNIVVDSPLGIGLVDNNLSLVDAINVANDQFVREVKLGKRRIAVGAELIKPTVNQQPQYGELPNQGYPSFAEDDDVFMQLASTRDDKSMLQDLTNDIRVDQYSKTLQMYIHQFENAVGLSQGTLSVNDSNSSGTKTATEVVSDNSRTYRTRSSYLTMVEKQLRGLITTIVELSSIGELFDNGTSPLNYDLAANPLDINIHFEDGVFVDKDAQAKSDMLAVQAGIMPKIEFLRRNYGLSEEDAQRWLSEVQGEAPEDDFTPPNQRQMLGDDGA
ncbi:phage portal protein [Convivina intestini]|uniref:A118 family predicted phage portal protein n=2 Tax=Convivina intestini TaxID=1505726 RepID=A0A2U1DFS1_9LACO|nr:phage portal protein [Convivina intestini]PVY86518.1 A118 family predicted phage portal protein [Convivina intestini]CAH1857483.1 hypothetical protein R077811_01528 [Convivina intestini]SDC13320.1 phage portal protein, putative, A118 family [Leuconostocaceae bacterium R-53105]